MSKYALYVPLEAKPGKEKEVADFLRSAIPLVNAEAGTISWFAIQEGLAVALLPFGQSHGGGLPLEAYQRRTCCQRGAEGR